MLPLTDEARAMGRKKAPTLSERLVSAGASEEQLLLASTAARLRGLPPARVPPRLHRLSQLHAAGR